MRVDLLLKSLCLVKTRNQGKKGCDAGCVKLNSVAVRPSREVRAGDILEIRYSNRTLVIEIIDIPVGQVSRRDREHYFRVVEETRVRTEDRVWDE